MSKSYFKKGSKIQSNKYQSILISNIDKKILVRRY